MSNRHAARTDMSDMGRAAEEIEVEQAANHQLIQEGRIIRSKELEKRRREEENGTNGYRAQDNSLKIGSNSASRFSSQRSSIDMTSGSGSSVSRSTTDARELRTQLLQLEEKFKGAMMANVQLDNDKQLLRYEVDLLKDKMEDLSESNISLQKSFLDKKRELAYQRMQVTELSHRLEFAQKQIEARDRLLVEHDLILLGGSDLEALPPLSVPDANTARLTNGHASSDAHALNDNQSEHEPSSVFPTMALVSKTTAEMLNSLPVVGLEAQIQHLFSVRTELTNRVEKLESDLAAERKPIEMSTSRYDSRIRVNGPAQADLKQEVQHHRSQAQEFKCKLQEALQKNTSLESDIVRLEGQIKRYKTIAETCEQQEAELKQECRKCQRAMRELQNQLEDVKADNARLQRKLGKQTRVSVAPTGLVGSSLRGVRESSAQR